MQPRASLRRVGTAIHVGATGVVTAGLLALAANGSNIVQGNMICDVDANPTCSIVSGINAVLTPLGFGVGDDDKACTQSGGYATANTCYVESPYKSANANGLPSSQSGILAWVQFEIISNPRAYSYDCWIATGPNVASGASNIQLVNNATATGYVMYLPVGSGSYTGRRTILGPTQGIACNTLSGSGAGTVRLTAETHNTRIGRFDVN